MLVAELKDGERVALVTEGLSLSRLRQLRTRETFYCPVCHTPVLLKLGSRRRWHFSHRPRQGCLIDMEAESETHLDGKRFLYNWAAGCGEAVTLEHYLPALRQRPDIYLPGIEPMAIEFQCSTIPEQVIDARTSGYLGAGIEPVWILGSDRHRRIGGYLRITGFEQHAIRKSLHVSRQQDSFISSYYLCYFHPREKQVILENPLFPVSKTRFIAGEMKISLSDFRLYRLKSPISSFSRDLFKSLLLQEKKKIRLRPPWRVSSEEQWLRKQVYLRHQYFSLLPPYTGLPHERYLHLEVSPLLWQYWICLLLRSCKKGTWFTPEQILRRSKESGGDVLFVRRKMPLCPVYSTLELIQTYLSQLTALRVLHQRSNAFCLSPEAVLKTESLPVLLEWDEAVLNRLSTNCFPERVQ
ncbi:competence protein CoiA [Sporolactobacillus vineae]|uniref:competence protein CoiA n=1 Tax=Sporolactobacillus vineae TaxID=444463 RepID=UPI000289A552|nr:competence protein CoiA family protein [Sporolactobacillus vineae]